VRPDGSIVAALRFAKRCFADASRREFVQSDRPSLGTDGGRPSEADAKATPESQPSAWAICTRTEARIQHD
jgi:hypothetical protein